MGSARVLLLCAALCVANASQEQGVAQRLWSQAWADALDQAGLSNANLDNMPPELKESLQNKAQKLWRMALAQRHAVETTTTMAEEVTTTQNAALKMLLQGIDGNPVVDDQQAAAPVQVSTTTTTTVVTTTTTTTTEDQALKEQQQAQLMALHKNVMAKLTSGLDKDDLIDATSTTTEATTTVATTTTINKAMLALLSGVDGNIPVAQSSFLAKPAAPKVETTTTTTTAVTTTTEDPRVREEREQQKQQLLALHKNVMSKLTSGLDKIDKEEATATTTTATTTTTTTTKNLAMAKLLEGIDGQPVAQKVKGAKKTTTATTTTTTTTQTIGAAGKKTLAFIESGTYQEAMPHNQEAAAPEEADDDEDETPEATDGGDTAALLDMDNSA